MIYKIFSVILTCFCALPCFSLEKATVQYDEYPVDYSVLDGNSVVKEGDSFFEQYEKTGDVKFLTTAMGKYYIATKIHPNELYPVIQLAKTYDEKNIDRRAKEYFNRGLDMDNTDAYLNYSFGNFYFKRADYKRALKYYKKAYNNGYAGYYDINLKIATIYEKFADLLSAKYYYDKAYSINSKISTLKDKSVEIDSLDYGKSEYYNGNK